MKYWEIKEEMSKHHFDGIFFAFSEEQFKEGLEELGLKETDNLNGVLFHGKYGDFGTKQGFIDREKYYAKMEQRIKDECSPDEIFEYEWYNHECGYTWDWSFPLAITRGYFPDYEVNKELLKELQSKEY